MSFDGIGSFAGWDGFRLLGTELAGGLCWQLVETTASVTACAGCGTRARSKGRRVVVLADTAVAGLVGRVAWRKRRWSCPDPDCEVGSWTEQRPDVVRASTRVTTRARTALAEGVAGGRTVADVAAEHGVSWATAWSAVQVLAVTAIEAPEARPVTALGVDEHVFSSGRIGRHYRSYATVLIDAQRGRALDVVAGRGRDDVAHWLAQRDRSWLGSIDSVVLDGHRPFRAAFAHLEVRLVLDPFHVVSWANRVVTRTRQDVQRRSSGRRGQRRDPLYGIRHLLLKAYERIDPSGQSRLRAGLAAGDPDGQLQRAWEAKELVRAVYATDDPGQAQRRLERAITHCLSSGDPRLLKLGRTLRRNAADIVAHHHSGVANGRSEAANLTAKNVKRAARGCRNFENYRIRVLLRLNFVRKTPIIARAA